jgi:hypothetical protein
MRGADACNEALFSTVRLKDFVPAVQPLHAPVVLGRNAPAVCVTRAKEPEVTLRNASTGALKAPKGDSSRDLRAV